MSSRQSVAKALEVILADAQNIITLKSDRAAIQEAAQMLRETPVVPRVPHAMTAPDGSVYACLCPLTDDHPFMSEAPEQYAERMYEALLVLGWKPPVV